LRKFDTKWQIKEAVAVVAALPVQAIMEVVVVDLQRHVNLRFIFKALGMTFKGIGGMG